MQGTFPVGSYLNKACGFNKDKQQNGFSSMRKNMDDGNGRNSIIH